ncbi:hypothetical protein PV721_04070 [Streptomyces sp. MB09-01]|nr:hypothetical protein [Streptomyces sp. MB09-01]MDX3533560.1 hypothetical protein [Streptomyces sp. MB09-01]
MRVGRSEDAPADEATERLFTARGRFIREARRVTTAPEQRTQ